MTKLTKLARRHGAGVLVALAASMSTPAFAAPGGEILGYSLNAAACRLDITARVEDAGFYAINVWDDGTFHAGAGANVASQGTLVVRLSIGGPITQTAPGIGLYLENAVGPAATATYDSEGSAQPWDDTVGNACAAANTPWGATVLSSSVTAVPTTGLPALLLLAGALMAVAVRRFKS